ncbi:condensin complex subunit 2-like [Symsagittifera roscoffensis]|uniref:condensin complex subunit 2-like n=1 Tax=Symsagittifera roscoffensis TaxID=84072 RepID=UPI00307BF972
MTESDTSSATSSETPKNNEKRRRKSLLRQSLLNATFNSSVIEEGCLSPASKANTDELTDGDTHQNQARRSVRADDVLSSSHVPNKEQLEVVSRPNMDTAQVVSHYQSCIQAANSGKLNSKNAFSLHLIDMMGEVLKTINKDQFFQTAGCTIDVGAKIYSYRVDGLHTDAYRVANILGGGKKEDKENADDGEADMESEVPIRLKKKKKNFKCIVQDTSKIFKHVVYNVDHDAIRLKAGSLIDTTNNDFVSLNLPIEEGDDRKERIVTDGKEKMRIFKTEYPDASTFPLISKDALNLPTLEDLKRKVLCPPIDEIYRIFNESLLNRTNDEGINDSRLDKFLTDVQDNFAFDPDAPPVPDNDDYSIHFDQDENIGSVSRLEETFGAVPHGSESSSGEFDLMGQSQLTVIEPSLENLLKFIQPGEFTNFSEPVLNAFFGTRAKAAQRRGSKAVKKKTKTSPDSITVEYKLETVSLANEKRQAATTLSDRNLDKNKKTCAELSREEYPRQKWTSYFELELDFAKFHKSDKRVPKDVHIEIEEGYNYQNELDKSNVAPVFRDDDYQDDGNDKQDMDDDEPQFFNANGDDFDVDDFANNENEINDNALVDQPVYTQQFKLNYSKRAKTVDVRKVKQCMLATLINKAKETENTDKESTVELTELFAKAKRRLPERAVGDLSIPITLVALLDLANEKSLKLDTNENRTNVLASFEDNT